MQNPLYVSSNPGGVASASAGSPFGIVVPRSPVMLNSSRRVGSEPSLTPRTAVGLPSRLGVSTTVTQMQDSSSSSLVSEELTGRGKAEASTGQVSISIPPPPPLESKGGVSSEAHKPPATASAASSPPAPPTAPAKGGGAGSDDAEGGGSPASWGVMTWAVPFVLSFLVPIAGIIIVCLVGTRSTARFAGLLVLGLLLALALFLAVGFDSVRWGRGEERAFRKRYLGMWIALIVGAAVTTPVVTVISHSRPDYGAREQFRLEGAIFFAATGHAPAGCAVAPDSELARAVLMGPRTAMSPVTGCVRLAGGVTLKAGTGQLLDPTSTACRNTETPSLFKCTSPIPITLVDLESAPVRFPPEALARLPNGTTYAAITGVSASSPTVSPLCGTHGIRVPDGWSVASHPGNIIASLPFSGKSLILADGSCVSSTLATCGGGGDLISYGRFVATTSCDKVALLISRNLTAPVISTNGTAPTATPAATATATAIPSSLPAPLAVSQLGALTDARLINQSSAATSSFYVTSTSNTVAAWNDVVADTSGSSSAVMTASVSSSASLRVASARMHATAQTSPALQIWVSRLRSLENLDLTKPQDLSLQVRVVGLIGGSSSRSLLLVRATNSSWDSASGLVARPYLSAFMASAAAAAAGDAASAPPAPALVNLFVNGQSMGLYSMVPSVAESILAARPDTLYVARFASTLDFTPQALAGAQPQLIYSSTAAASARAPADLADLASAVASAATPLIASGLFSRENALAVLALVSSTGACGVSQTPFYLSAELLPSQRLAWRLTWGAGPDTMWTGSACEGDPLPLPTQRLARNPVLARFLAEIVLDDISTVSQSATAFLADAKMGWERSPVNASAAIKTIPPRAPAPAVTAPWPVEILPVVAVQCPTFKVSWSDLLARTAASSLLLRQGPDAVTLAFDVEVSDSSDFVPSATVLNRTALTDHSVNISALQVGNRYFVRVASRYVFASNNSYASAASTPASNSYVTGKGRLLLGVASFVASCSSIASSTSTPTPTPTPAPSPGSPSPSATPKPPKLSDYRVASISRVVVIANTAFASIDDADPQDRGTGCSRSLSSLPSPWVVAAPDGPARLLLSSAKFGFDTECLVLSNGAAVSTAGGGPCAPPVALSSYLVIASGNATGTLAFAAACSASGMTMRVLVSRPAGPDDLASTYDPEALASVPAGSIRTTLTGDVLQLSTVDGSDPEDQVSDCQGPRAIPAGWALANYSASAVLALAYKPWGTECLVFAGGIGIDISGQPCGPGNSSAIVNRVGAYFAPSFCDARLVISRPVPPIPCVPGCAAGRGFCVGRTGLCTCFPGFSGATCTGTNPLLGALPANYNFSIVDPVTGRATGFSAFGTSGYTVAPASFGTGLGGPTSRSIVANLTSPTASGGLALPLSLTTLRSLANASNATHVAVGVWSLAFNVSATLANTDYSLYMDTTTTSVGSLWQGFRFSPTAQGWQYGETIVNLTDTLTLNAYLMFRNRVGVAYFSDITLRLPCDGVTCNNGGVCAPATGRCTCSPPYFGALCMDTPVPPLVEDKSVYTLHADDDQAATSAGPPVFWITAIDTDEYQYSDLLADMDPNDSYEPTIKAEISTTNDLPYTVNGTSTFVNVSATMARRGSASRLQFKPSFKYALKSRTWRGLSTIHLAAVDWDNTKLRNVVAMKLFREVPNLSAIRVFLAQVNMRIGYNGNWTSVGLHNCIEQVSPTLLAERGLDGRSALFKSQQYTYTSSPGFTLTTEPGFNLTTFELSFSVGGAMDTRAPVGLTRDLADTARFPTLAMVLQKHVNLDNYMAWLASMLLVYHFDSTVHNWLWYSPYKLNGVGLYWLPYDCDGCFRNRPDVGQYLQPNTWGINLFWALPFFRRVLSDPTYRNMLIARVDQLRATVFTEANVRSKITPFRDLVKAASADPALVDSELDSMIGSVTDFYQKFQWSLTAPLVTRLSVSPDKTQVIWVPSVHLLGLPVTYSISVYTDYTNLTGSRVGTYPAPCSQSASLCSFSRPASLQVGTTYYLVMTFVDTSNRTMTGDGAWLCTTGPVYGDRLCTAWTPSA